MEGREKGGEEEMPAHAQCPLPLPIWILTGPIFRIFSFPQNYHSQKTTTRSPEVFGNFIGELEAFKRHESWTQKSHLGPSDQGWSKMGEDSPSSALPPGHTALGYRRLRGSQQGAERGEAPVGVGCVVGSQAPKQLGRRGKQGIRVTRTKSVSE